jgi:hypothetical protein
MKWIRGRSMTFEYFQKLSQENLDACVNFLENWERLSREGVCDASHGAEFNRVFLEYLKANKPSPVGEFIRERANLPAPNSEAPPAVGLEGQS